MPLREYSRRVQAGESETRIATAPPLGRLLSGATAGPLTTVAFVVATLACLVLAAQVSFLLFHVLTELFFVLVATSVFVIAWILRDFLDDDFALFLGVALVAVGGLRLVHMLDFAGMGVLDTPDPDQATQLWVIAAALLAVSFLLAPALVGRRMSLPLVLGAYGLFDALALATVYWWEVVPEAYATPGGLTTFKKVAEYAVCAILVAAVVTLLRSRRRLRPAAVPLLVAAYALTVAAELVFTVYAGVYTWPLALGHLLGVVAAILVYKAVVEAGLARPLALEVDNLRLSERAARSERERAEEVRREFDELLELTPTFHVETGSAETALAVCRGARRMFECQSATLFAADGDEIVVEARDPQAALMRPGTRYDIAADLELRRLVNARTPSFVVDAADHPLLPLGVDRRVSRRAESALRVPIGVGPAADKVLILTWGATRPKPDQVLLALVQRFADNAGAALALAAQRDLQAETRRLYERLESSLMPLQTVDHPVIDVATRYRSGARGLRIGGDFVGIAQQADGRVAAAVGDVSGHGPDAAALGATLRGSWRALALADVDWQTTFDTLAGVLVRERRDADDFVTLCAVIVAPDCRSAELVNVAHPQPLLIVPRTGGASGGDAVAGRDGGDRDGGAGAEEDDVLGRGRVAVIEVAPYPPVGAFAGIEWRPTTVALPPGPWQVLLYTDGLIDARVSPQASERLGVEGLVDVVAGRLGAGLLDDEALDGILTDIEARAGGPLGDDVAMVAVTCRGEDMG
jgi:serine phosphatase RsbU (regulator of sigma subunit)